MQPKDIPMMQRAIQEAHGCQSVHVDSQHVHELFNGLTAWQGTVEIFNLVGHPKAQRAFVWQYDEGQETKTITVLEIPPVDSPESAVKVAIAAKARQK
jgi:hypothetical protein